MSVVEWINKRPKTVGAVAAVVVIVAASYSMKSFSTGVQAPDQTLTYFSDDDGKTYFADNFLKPSGFDHNGKPAYSASVFSRNGGTPTVGYLRRTGSAPAAAAPVAAAPKSVAAMKVSAAPRGSGAPSGVAAPPPPPPPAPAAAGPAPTGRTQTQVKRPGEPQWHNADEPAGKAILAEFGPAAQEKGLDMVLP